ncbi:molybdate ABC transporter substrate-binding protein [Catellatospora sp. KI3]|uniref:molybdate ABC transporter substrate-binding protein n=1 Tax=Catellatospora sp. KI3 TaxID=3041620 RepID=UPI00248316F7|nr:molybdate ABC transporter substrate-binding protein [Catellatospora sp. KI3]MDI1461579.1 molybdate ABC transporter substrate-binding protein [Catellatospora sp. KI3]
MSSGWIRTALAAVSLVAATALAGCGTDTPKPAASGGGGGISGEVTVFAAASLTEAFTQIGKDFEAAHPGTKVTFNFGGSSGLATQITQGAPADVFASASPATMKTVVDAGDAAGSPVVFARNQLVIAVPKFNPRGLTELANLGRPDVKVALCAEQVPCGAAARKALAAAGVAVTPVTLEQDVKAALQKVRLGEVDAALVYRTDTRASAADVDSIEFPESAEAINDYPVVLLKGAPNKAAAQAFLEYLQTGPAKAVLSAAGFQAP